MILSLVAAAEPEPVAAPVLGVVEPLDAVVGARPGLGLQVAELTGWTGCASFGRIIIASNLNHEKCETFGGALFL